MQTAMASGLHRRDAAFAAARQRRHDEYVIFKNAVLGTIQRSPVPLTANDLVVLLSRNPTSVINALTDLQADGRIVSRRETSDEKLVRGGGVMPKAKAAKLFVAAPGPVPERTHLPEGIAPHRSLEYRVLEELGRRYTGGTGANRPKSIGRLAEHLGVDREELRKVLHKLEKRGKVYQNCNSWFIVGKRARAGETKRPTPKKRRKQAKTVAQITPTGTTVTVQGATETQREVASMAPGDGQARARFLDQIAARRTTELVNQIGELVGQLASLAGTQDTDTVGVLTERVRHLEDENATLRAKLAHLRDALQG